MAIEHALELTMIGGEFGSGRPLSRLRAELAVSAWPTRAAAAFGPDEFWSSDSRSVTSTATRRP